MIKSQDKAKATKEKITVLNLRCTIAMFCEEITTFSEKEMRGKTSNSVWFVCNKTVRACK